jgi:hypothetical protein
LVIGNAAYPDADAPLKEPVTDARALGDAQAPGMTSPSVKTSKKSLQQALDQFYAKIHSGATAVIFLADLQFNPTGKPT